MICNAMTLAVIHVPFAIKTIDWHRISSSDIAINIEEVHLWRLNLNIDNVILDKLKTLLSIDELHRAEKFRYEPDRKRFIARKGMHRLILGRYMGIQPKNIQFNFCTHGKPLLASVNSSIPINFSASSSGDLGLLAVTYNHQLGVDMENINRTIEYEKIASSFFSPLEAEQIRSLKGKKQRNMFLVLWTAKEAYLKAAGTELLFALYNTKISLSKILIPSIFKLNDPSTNKISYSGLCFELGETHIVTLVVED